MKYFLKDFKAILKKYNKIYIFPFNFQSKFIKKKFKLNKKIIFLDNNLENIFDKKLIKPEKIEDDKKNILIITDKEHLRNINIKLNKVKKIILNLKNPNEIHHEVNLDKLKIRHRSLSKLFEIFNTDKGKYYKRFNIKEQSHDYGEFYSKILSKYRNKKINILEIGTYNGSSTAAFFFFFKKANFFGIDIRKNLYKSKRIMFFKLDYTDQKKVNLFKKKYKNFFDIIIDDGGHYKSHIIKNLKNFFHCLSANKFSHYIIEDFDIGFDYINDNNKEFNIKEILDNFKKKTFFKSKILNFKNQRLISDSIKRINIYKGKYIKNGKNISNIGFLKIKKIYNDKKK
jgi:hypothetical protein